MRIENVRHFGRRVSAAIGIGLFTAAVAGAQTYEVVHRFRNSEATVRTDAASQSRLILAPDGDFYGTTYWGGSSGFGTIYRMDPAGTTTPLHSFAYADGANPAAGLVLSSDGSLYGTTEAGGAHNLGTVFRMDASGAVTRLHSFDGADGQHPLATLFEASDGKFYGTTSAGGTTGVGVIFRIDSSGVFELLHSFDRYVDGARPVAELLEARGAFYGTTREGGVNNLGTVFLMDLTGSVTSFHSFAGADGYYPVAALISSVSGDLYGTTSYSGSWGPGLVYRIDIAGQVTTLHSFDSETEGAIPLAPLVQGSDGSLYGTVSGGAFMSPVRYGTVFRMTDTGTVTVLHAFDGTDGAAPEVSLVQTSDGSFYGLTTTRNVAPLGQVAGTVFRIDSGPIFTTVHRFGWRDGEGPAYLLPASDGFIYGSTSGGGTIGHGTIFRMDSSGQVATLHNLEGGVDGRGPAQMMQAGDGTIYGTDEGGASDFGQIFRLEASGDTTTLHSFDGDDGDGAQGLVEGSDEKLYGTTRSGGGAEGAFFRIDTSGDFESLGGFSLGGNGLAHPNGPLVSRGDKFYGTTTDGGHGFGCIFEASAENSVSIQYCFAEDGSQGGSPLTPLTDMDGDLWGTTSLAGEFGLGTAFLTLPGFADVDTKHSFTADEGPAISLSFAGGLFGTTGYAAQTPKGTIFSMDTDSGSLTTIFAFPGQMDGGYPTAPVRGSDGLLYGTAGVIYRLSNATVATNQILPTAGPPSGGGGLIVMGGGFADSSSVAVGGDSGSDLTVVDSTFLYLFTPPLSPGTLNDVTVTVPTGLATATATLPNAYFADFLDLPQIDPFHDYVEKIFRNGITAGCGGGNYCPQEAVTRAQMAVFLLKSEHGSAYVPPACAGLFDDVPCLSMFADWIEQLASEGITAGCGGGNYCPTSPVTRAQMAVFLLKTKHGPGFAPPPCTGVFADVACPSLFADWIEQLAAEQITGGCGGGNYCPDNPNTRAQMSAFLVKTFGM